MGDPVMISPFTGVIIFAAYLERLGIPVLHFLDRGHLIQSVGQVPKFLYSMCQPYGKLFGEELGSAEEGTLQLISICCPSYSCD